MQKRHSYLRGFGDWDSPMQHHTLVFLTSLLKPQSLQWGDVLGYVKGPLNATCAVGRIGCVARIAVTGSITYKSGLELGFFLPFSFPLHAWLLRLPLWLSFWHLSSKKDLDKLKELPRTATKMMKELEVLIYKERLKEWICFSLASH